jgi:hypothetical protein
MWLLMLEGGDQDIGNVQQSPQTIRSSVLEVEMTERVSDFMLPYLIFLPACFRRATQFLSDGISLRHVIAFSMLWLEETQCSITWSGSWYVNWNLRNIYHVSWESMTFKILSWKFFFSIQKWITNVPSFSLFLFFESRNHTHTSIFLPRQMAAIGWW